MRKSERADSLQRAARYLALTLFALGALYPIVQILALALATRNDALSATLIQVPKGHALANLKTLFISPQIQHSILKFVLVVVIATISSVAVSFAIAQLLWQRNSRGRNSVRAGAVSAAFPAMLSLLPVYGLLVHLHIVTALSASINLFALTAIPCGVRIVGRALGNIPQTCLESAHLDGASRLQAFRFVTGPIIAPFLCVAALISICLFVAEYGSLYLASVVQYPLPADSLAGAALCSVLVGGLILATTYQASRADCSAGRGAL